MGVDTVLEIDFSQLTKKDSQQLVTKFDEVIKKTTKENTKLKKKRKELTKKQKESEEEKTKEKLSAFKDNKKSKVKDIQNLEIVEGLTSTEIGVQGGLNFFISQFKTSLPVIGPIIAVSGFFINELLKLDVLAKKFLDIADTRISVFVDRQDQARLDAHLDQIIYTTKAGTASPRDSYNSFNDYDRFLKQDGTDRNASSIGDVD